MPYESQNHNLKNTGHRKLQKIFFLNIEHNAYKKMENWCENAH
jgi:hypothetical protein